MRQNKPSCWTGMIRREGSVQKLCRHQIMQKNLTDGLEWNHPVAPIGRMAEPLGNKVSIEFPWPSVKK